MMHHLMKHRVTPQTKHTKSLKRRSGLERCPRCNMIVGTVIYLKHLCYMFKVNDSTYFFTHLYCCWLNYLRVGHTLSKMYAPPVRVRRISHLLMRCVVRIVQRILNSLRMTVVACYLVFDSCTFCS
jgi:hypothetical protein